MVLLIPGFLIVGLLERAIAGGAKPTVWWQLLAYAIITAAEIMVSIPALEFAYTQAPRKMKSVIMAAYLAGSISLGNFVAARMIQFFKRDWVAPYVKGANYYWVFVALIIVAALIYVLAMSVMPMKDFVAEDVPAESKG
jgi:POT family proton-dependent oligopeptide transporter